MAALRLRLQKEMFDVTEEQLLALAHVTNSQVNIVVRSVDAWVCT